MKGEYLPFNRMSTILYGGVKYTKVRHAVYCLQCRTTIEWKEKLLYCPCGGVGIDRDRILYTGLFEDRSVWSAKVGNKTVWLPIYSYKTP